MGRILKTILCFAAAMVVGGGITEAKVKLPRLVGDGMVLQRETPLKIWGWADAGERVSVVFQDKTYITRADRRGEWSIGLPSLSAGGPYTMRVNEIELRDVMVGEVWLCSGQSNMELPVSRVMDMFADEVRGFDYPDIRHFRVPMKYSFGSEESDLAGGEWKAATQENIGEFSAVAFFFGKELHEMYGVPVGLINTAIGGSPIEAWICEKTIEKYPLHLAAARECARPGLVDSIRTADAVRAGAWYRSLDEGDPGIGLWNDPGLDDTGWGVISLPGYWADKGVDTAPGMVWFRREVELPAGVEDKESILRLGVVVDADSTWVNGVFVGNVTYQYPPRIYRVPAGVLRQGRNVIAVRVSSNSGRGGFVEEKPYKLIVGREGGAWGNGGEDIDLTGDWKYRVGARVGRMPSSTTFQYKPTGLYNGMIAPLRNFAVKGFLWYQGESNVGRAAEYRDLMTDLINDWRADRNNPEMPFLYAQLSGMMEGSGLHPENNHSGWAELRDVQRQMLRLPHTGMATIHDVGEWNDVHPLDKKTVGHRLALEARRVAYGECGVSGAGPLYENMTVEAGSEGKAGSEGEAGSAILTFKCLGAGLDTSVRLRGFAIAGADKKYVPANAVVMHGNTIRVWSPTVAEPVAVRYAWAGDPVGANLRDRDGIPASSFEAELVVTADRIGYHDGYDWELWHQQGEVAMTLGEKGAFGGSWKGSHNVLFRTGKKFYPPATLDRMGRISLDYGCDYRPDGNSYLCVYGWSVDPLVEFYVVEAWGDWRPPGAKSKGTVTIDGGTYDIYETTRVEMPSIQGTRTFKQFWSVRTERLTEGTVSVSDHIEAWRKKGMRLGDIYEIAFCIEGYESSGEADVWRHELKIEN